MTSLAQKIYRRRNDQNKNIRKVNNENHRGREFEGKINPYCKENK